MNIIVVGSINLDTNLKLPELPEPGETLTADQLQYTFGSKGANQAVAAARLGNKVRMIGAVGNDDTGQQLVANLQKAGVDTKGVKTSSKSSGAAFITIDQRGDKTIIVYPGANSDVDEAWVKKHEMLIKQADCMMLQLELPVETIVVAARMAYEHGVKVILNPAPVKKFPKELYKYCAVVTPNESELKCLTFGSDIEDGCALLLRQGVSAVVVTLGSSGCFYKDQNNALHVTAFDVDPVDTTAAGDAFSAALATKLGQDSPLKEALEFANAAGGLATNQLGAQTSLPTLRQIKKFLKHH